jgi:thymidylate synthase
VITKLAGEIDTASAVMSLWDVKDHEVGGSPCLNHIWLRVVEGELSLTATFRSNDMFSAWPSNAMALRALQFHILDNLESRYGLDLSIGPLITLSQSAHIYDDCWGSVDNLIAAHYHYRPSYADPVGYFVIEWIDGCIVVTHSTPHGDPVRQYRGRDPLKVVRAICHDNPAIAPDHAAYLGLELARAAARQDSYIQDARL